MMPLRIPPRQHQQITMLPSPWPSPLLLVFLLLLQFLLILPAAQGMITVMETGEQFAMKPDAHFGPLLRRGYEYEARLQYIGDYGGRSFADLCPPPPPPTTTTTTTNDDNFTVSIIVPPFPDLYGRPVPVALLAQETGRCSLATKLQFIQQHVKPANIVKYLIVESSRSTVSTSWIIEDPDDEGEEEEDQHHVDDSNDGPNSTQQDHVVLQRTPRDESVPITVLHVTPRTLSNLWTLVNQQSRDSRLDGGPQIQVDARLNNGALSSIWVALCAITSACCCSFFLACGNQRGGYFGDPDEIEANINNNNNHHPRVREPRRRLTREQVKRLFPIYRFNGQCLEAIPDGSTASSTTPPSTRQEELTQGLLTSQSHDDVEKAVVVPQPVELSDCSICLDDYQAGDRLRCLPCNHAFHAKCIAKWLAERSATCPLCKAEICDDQPEDDENDDDDDDGIVDNQAGNNNNNNNNRSTPNQNNNDPGAQYFFGSQLASWVTLGNSTRSFAEDPGTEIAQGGGGGGDAATTTTAQSSSSNVATSTSWWRRVFSSSSNRQRGGQPLSVLEGGDSSEAAALAEMLTEPLLLTDDAQTEPSHQQQQQQQQHGTRPTRRRPDPSTAAAIIEPAAQPIIPGTVHATAANDNAGSAATETSATTRTSTPDPPGAQSRQVSV